MRIPFYKPCLGSEEINEVVDTLKSGWLTTGPKTKQFEREFADYLKHKHAVAVNSCTAALHLALEAIGLKAGQGVIVPTMTFAATAEVVRYLGGRPILVDCRAEDFNLDVADAERRIQSALAAGQQVSAIMPVHYGGQIGDVEGVKALAQRYNLKIVEDAAHCCPAYYRPKSQEQGAGCGDQGEMGQAQGSGVVSALPTSNFPLTSQPSVPSSSPASDWLSVGSSSDISCFSFYANKTITTGEGGMVCTESDTYADRMRIMSLHGISRDAWKRYTAEGSWYYEIIAPGYKYNLTDIASAIGIHQLRKAELFHKRRVEIVRRYQEALKDVEEIILPQAQPDRIHSWHLFVIRLRLDRLTVNRSEFIDRLKEAGIATSVHYTPLHMHPYYRDKFGYRPEDLPCMASIYPQIISLPIYPDLTDDDVDFVCRTIRDLVAQGKK
jgi:perosamine synthetase